MKRDESGVERKVKGLNFRKIIGARAKVLGYLPTPEQLDILVQSYEEAHPNGVLDYKYIDSALKFYALTPIVSPFKDPNQLSLF